LNDYGELYGGYPPGGGSDAQRNPGGYLSILSGEIGDPGWADNCFHVVTTSGGYRHAETRLDGFVVRDGAATGGSTCEQDGCGGGIYNYGDKLILNNLFVRENYANYGGGVANELSLSVTLDQVIFERNMALVNGGGFYNYGSSPDLGGCIFRGNRTIGNGAGIYHQSGSLDLANTVLVGNQAGASGGGIYSRYEEVSLINSTLMENEAGTAGSGIYLNNSDLDLVNSIVYASTDWPVTLVSGATVDADYSLLRSGCPVDPDGDCGLIINTNPLFRLNPGKGPDGSWGGSDDNYGDLRLAIPSPAIDAGDNKPVVFLLSIDADGLPRFVDIPSVPDTGWSEGGAPVVDMGAYETHFWVFLPLAIR
jgi:hypothetical protein